MEAQKNKIKPLFCKSSLLLDFCCFFIWVTLFVKVYLAPLLLKKYPMPQKKL